MKATLEFNLSDPDDRHEHTMAVRGSDFACAWDDLFQFIRGKLKYETLDEEAAGALEMVRGKMVEIERDRNLPELP